MVRVLIFNLLIVLISSCRQNSNKENHQIDTGKKVELIDSNILSVRHSLSTCTYLLIAFPINIPHGFIADSVIKDSITQFYPFISDSIKYDSCKPIKPFGTLILKA